MENVVNAAEHSAAMWHGRSVLLTGHTGFKGSWLAIWLHMLGARVHGYALDPPTKPSLFEAARVAEALASDTRADLADFQTLRATFERVQPEVIFHLAAQPLVRESYVDPRGTFLTNVTGTAHLLEAARLAMSPLAIVVVTTDKVYENQAALAAHREEDRLGGQDPYSASKAAAELVAASYRASFFAPRGAHRANIATARAGNVIGGGDWAVDRLVPDCLRAFSRAEAVQLRYPDAIRPWQHVLEPLGGYLRLAAALLEERGVRFASAWNFGPFDRDDATVGEVADLTAKLWGPPAHVVRATSAHHPPEAGMLKLDSTRARTRLDWQPRWPLQHALERTVSWHRAWLSGEDMACASQAQIREYACSEVQP